MNSFSSTRPLALGAVLALTTSACFTPNASDDDVGSDTGTETAGSEEDTTDTTTDTTTDATDTEVGDQAPVFVSFTIAGSTTPETVDAAGAVPIVVEASDPDGTIDEIRVYLDDDLIETFTGEGPHAGEFIVGGGSFDGSYEFRAIAVDNDGLEVESELIPLTVDVPEGSLIETWTYDSGSPDSSVRIAVDPDGTMVVVGGSSDNQMRIDRFVGGGWNTNSYETSYVASGVVILPNGHTAAVAWSNDDNSQSQLFDFDADGTMVDLNQGDWTSPGTPQGNFEAPLDNAVDSEGNIYIVGVFAGGPGSPDSTYMFKYNQAGTLLWQFHSDVAEVTEHSMYGIKMSVGTDSVLVSGQARTLVDNSTVSYPWTGRWDLSGNFIDDIVLDDNEGIAWDVGAGPDGSRIVGGTLFLDGSDNESWLGRFSASGQPVWTKQGGHEGVGAIIATGIDPWGDSVSVMAEDCTNLFLSVGNCNIYIRKHDAGGDLVWEVPFEDNGFGAGSLVPIAADLEFDRFGYAYVTAVHQGPETFDFWAVKIHP